MGSPRAGATPLARGASVMRLLSCIVVAAACALRAWRVPTWLYTPGSALALCASLVFALAGPSAPAFALDVPPLQGRVNDRAGLLGNDSREDLEARLAGYERTTGHQLAVLTLR